MFGRGLIVSCFVSVLGFGGATVAQAQQVVNVPAGKRTLIGTFSLYNSESCTSGAIPEARVSSAPSNGKIDFVMEQRRINAGRCGGMMAWARAVYYTPKPGFRGQDETTVNFIYEVFSDGPERGNQSNTYRMNVR